MARETYSGFAVNAVDAKSRLSIPADHRAVIEKKSDERVVYLAPHARGLPCLIAYDSAYLARLQAKLDARFGIEDSDARDDETRRTLGLATPHNYDDAGRIMLSADWREWGGIDRLVAFVGMGDYFEVWNPDTLREFKKDDALIVRAVTRAIEARAA